MVDVMKDRFFDRELSLLEFQARVLAEAMDETNPLLERLKFLGIVSSNLDEFFMVRVASLYESGSETIPLVDEKTRLLVVKRDDYFMKVLVPELEKSGIVRVEPQMLQNSEMDYLKRFFEKELLPVLTPIAVQEESPLPSFVSLKLHVLFALSDIQKQGRLKYALVEVPSNFSRLIALPRSSDAYRFILLEDVLALFAKDLFLGYEIVDQGVIRLTRGAEMTLDEEKDEDFLKVMAEALRMRRQAPIVRLETKLSKHLLDFVKNRFKVTDQKFYEVNTWMDLKAISQLAFQPGFDALKRPAWEPRILPDFQDVDDIWKLLKEKNVITLLPYHSFASVNRFLETAAQDPDVLAIKQTLYRSGQDSSIISSLEKAAENGKQVTVLVELKARFDEEKNIEWARQLEKVGATVLYGVAGLKTHGKACLVVRREPEGIRRYVHLSTGNYNEKTAKLYSDIGFFTSDESFARDISGFFNMITGYSQPLVWSKIEVAPYTLRNRLIRLIMREAMRSSKEKPGCIMAKMNSLVDSKIIEALYRASQAGVKIKLNIRGICCLKPGVKGLSENIEVVSIVDMFLEHSRMYYFANGGEDELYLASADWMPRNLDRRLEIMFPIEGQNKKELLEILNLYFKDNVKSWRLCSDGSYERLKSEQNKTFRVQEFLCKRVVEEEEMFKKSLPKELRPQKASKAI